MEVGKDKRRAEYKEHIPLQWNSDRDRGDNKGMQRPN